MQQHQPTISPSYDDDFFAWTQHQARLLRAMRRDTIDLPAGIDIDHMAEELEDLGKAELRGVTSLIRQIFVHLIKAASDRGEARAHWRAEVTAFQADLPGYYAPSMHQLIDLNAIWEKALKLAEVALAEQTVALAPHLPSRCPYTIEELLDEDFDFDGLLTRLEDADR